MKKKNARPTAALALLFALFLIVLPAACRSTKTGATGGAGVAPPPTATPGTAPIAPATPGALPPGATPLPVRTPSSPSRYDRAPGVLYEENQPAPPTPAGPTPRPPRPSPTPTVTN